jgi:hypothetical protein
MKLFAMLRCCVRVKVQCGEGTRLEDGEETLRLHSTTTHEQFEELLCSTFGLTDKHKYKLVNGGCVCSVSCLVSAATQWLLTGDASRDMEIDTDGGTDRIIPVAMTVTLAAPASPPSSSAPSSGTEASVAQSSKSTRQHFDWCQDAWTVRVV